jgi:Ras family protein A
MAEKISAFACLECSTKSKEGVREIFESATKAALHAGLYLHTFF